MRSTFKRPCDLQKSREFPCDITGLAGAAPVVIGELSCRFEATADADTIASELNAKAEQCSRSILQNRSTKVGWTFLCIKHRQFSVQTQLIDSKFDVYGGAVVMYRFIFEGRFESCTSP